MSATQRPILVWRVRWRYPWWQASTSGRTRFFAMGTYANRFATKLQREGAIVEVARADRAIKFAEIDP